MQSLPTTVFVLVFPFNNTGNQSYSEEEKAEELFSNSAGSRQSLSLSGITLSNLASKYYAELSPKAFSEHIAS
jgi:hypothetical protein